MKVTSLTYLIFACFACFAVASSWSPEDYEIFGLNDKIQQDLGEETTFYSWLQLPQGPRATVQDITKAYRKISRQLHPDKFSGSTRKVKNDAEERFQRLSRVGSILRDQSLRKRYDYFLSKGFPKWKGTGFYYTRFRPGFILTLLLVFILISAFHFIALKINRKQDFKRLEDLRLTIKRQAWGSQIPPLDGSDRKLNDGGSGKTFLVKATGDVFLVELTKEGENLILIDENDINLNPGVKESLIFKLPSKVWNASAGRLFGQIDTAVYFEREHVEAVSSAVPEKKVKKKARGAKVELPNGKVVFGRPGRR